MSYFRTRASALAARVIGFRPRNMCVDLDSMDMCVVIDTSYEGGKRSKFDWTPKCYFSHLGSCIKNMYKSKNWFILKIIKLCVE